MTRSMYLTCLAVALFAVCCAWVQADTNWHCGNDVNNGALTINNEAVAWLSYKWGEGVLDDDDSHAHQCELKATAVVQPPAQGGTRAGPPVAVQLSIETADKSIIGVNGDNQIVFGASPLTVTLTPHKRSPNNPIVITAKANGIPIGQIGVKVGRIYPTVRFLAFGPGPNPGVVPESHLDAKATSREARHQGRVQQCTDGATVSLIGQVVIPAANRGNPDTRSESQFGEMGYQLSLQSQPAIPDSCKVDTHVKTTESLSMEVVSEVVRPGIVIDAAWQRSILTDLPNLQFGDNNPNPYGLSDENGPDLQRPQQGVGIVARLAIPPPDQDWTSKMVPTTNYTYKHHHEAIARWRPAGATAGNQDARANVKAKVQSDGICMTLEPHCPNQ